MTRSRYGVVAILLLAIASAAASVAHAETRGFARECAVGDLAAVTWVEEQAEKRAMAPALLAEAAFTVLRARNACMHGKVAEALGLYESVVSAPAQKLPSGSVSPVTQNPTERR